MTEEEKTEGTENEEPQTEDAGAVAPEQGDTDPDMPGREAEDMSGIDETPPSSGSDHDLTLSESDEGPADTAESPPETADDAEPPPDSVDTAESPPEPPALEPPKAEEKKPAAIPGADLEPIAVEPEAPRLSAEEQARLEAEEEERARREAELTGEVEEEPGAASRVPAKMEADARYLATGKRKNAIARVTLTPGDGKFEVNKRALEEFFPRPLHQTMAQQPLVTTGYEGNVDVRVLVHGGGISGQAGAVRHGIARALTEIDPELRGDLKRRGFLTRDARVKERRKAGLKKARKKPQFSKR
jgi:small subunit ribosomal protein S9